jgi:hypothetical protein
LAEGGGVSSADDRPADQPLHAGHVPSRLSLSLGGHPNRGGRTRSA